jgi:hypothetical protein
MMQNYCSPPCLDDVIYGWSLRKKIECLAGQQCVQRSECPQVQSQYKVYEAKTTNSALKAKTRRRLRSLICDKEEKLFCCNHQTKGQYLIHIYLKLLLFYFHVTLK